MGIKLTCPAPDCGITFDPADRATAITNAGAESQILYCSVACKRRTGNARYYAAHSEKIIARILKNQQEKK